MRPCPPTPRPLLLRGTGWTASSRAPIAFHLVESFTCVDGTSSCEVFPQTGLQGILGVSTPPGISRDIYSPVAQLSAEDSAGFVLHVGEPVGRIDFGRAATAQEGFTRVPLELAGLQPNGHPAFRDDALNVCFRVNGAPTSAPARRRSSTLGPARTSSTRRGCPRAPW